MTKLPTRAHQALTRLFGSGLAPGTTYYYQFTSGSAKSAVGRTRTLPVGDVDHARIAYMTCSQYPSGLA